MDPPQAILEPRRVRVTLIPGSTLLFVVVLWCCMIWKSLEGLRQMRRVFLDKCLEAKCREKPWKVRARTNGTQPIGRYCALSTQPNPQLQNRWFIGEF